MNLHFNIAKPISLLSTAFLTLPILLALLSAPALSCSDHQKPKGGNQGGIGGGSGSIVSSPVSTPVAGSIPGKGRGAAGRGGKRRGVAGAGLSTAFSDTGSFFGSVGSGSRRRSGRGIRALNNEGEFRLGGQRY